MAMGVRATLTGGALVEADRGCRRPHAGAVGAAEVGTCNVFNGSRYYLCKLRNVIKDSKTSVGVCVTFRFSDRGNG